jgi:MFS family permease
VPSVHYKWVALSNTTIGMLLATVNVSSVLIAMPAIFRGIGVDPLDPSNFGLLLWTLMGYMLVTAALVVNLGRIGDMYGRVRMYNLGFAAFTLASVGLSLIWSSGTPGALELIGLRMVQAVGGAMLMANTSAILTDAFPPGERGMALGINQVAGIGGSFVGLVAGGILSEIDWRLVFLINVPIGLAGTLWAYLALRETGERHPARVDWWGNATFVAGLGALLVGITYGIKPYGGHNLGWTNPFVIGSVCTGVGLLAAFVAIESRVADPMFRLGLFRIRAFAAGNLASLLASVGRGGLMFILIIWLQGIWLPLRGYSFERTPLWAGIYMLPLTVGFLVAGPVSGWLSDRYGARPFATGGMLMAAATFGMFTLLPVDFSYPQFAALLLLNGVAFGLFSSPNRAGIMNSVPARDRGVASGMSVTFQNAGMPLSIGIFFTLMIIGLSSALPSAMSSGLIANQVPAATAGRVAGLPPVGALFAAFLGYNPAQKLIGAHALSKLPPADAARLTGHGFFPHLLVEPFHQGLVVIFSFAACMCLIAAGASWMRGARYVHDEQAGATAPADAGGTAVGVGRPEG